MFASQRSAYRLAETIAAKEMKRQQRTSSTTTGQTNRNNTSCASNGNHTKSKNGSKTSSRTSGTSRGGPSRNHHGSPTWKRQKPCSGPTQTIAFQTNDAPCDEQPSSLSSLSEPSVSQPQALSAQFSPSSQKAVATQRKENQSSSVPRQSQKNVLSTTQTSQRRAFLSNHRCSSAPRPQKQPKSLPQDLENTVHQNSNESTAGGRPGWIAPLPEPPRTQKRLSVKLP